MNCLKVADLFRSFRVEQITECCSGVLKLATDKCHCNPAIDEIIGEEGQRVYQLEAVCRLVQPKRWLEISPLFLKKCSDVDTFEYGCKEPDNVIDAARFATIQKFGDIFTKADNDSCFDTPKITQQLAEVTTENVEFYVPYGAGRYKGYNDVAEYLGLVFDSLTHGFWANGKNDNSKTAKLEVSDDGRTWITGSTAVGGTFFNKQIAQEDTYLEQEFSFKGCETKFSDFKVIPTKGFSNLTPKKPSHCS